MKILILSLFLAGYLAVPHTMAQEPPIPPKKASTSDLITLYADRYGVSEVTMRRVIEGESQYRCNVYGDNGSAFGIAQFHKKTFRNFSNELGEKLDYYSCHDQIKLLAWALSKGYGNHWTAYRNLDKM